MPKLHSSRHLISVLKKNGFNFISQKGSHIKMRKRNLTVIVPANKRGIPIGTFKSILRQSGLSESDF